MEWGRRFPCLRAGGLAVRRFPGGRLSPAAIMQLSAVMGRIMLRVRGRCGIRRDRGGRRVRWLCGRGPASARTSGAASCCLRPQVSTATTPVHPILLVMEVVVSNAVADPRVALVALFRLNGQAGT
jgi:hypothetical protein